MVKKYWRIWWVFTTRATQLAFASRFGAVIFMAAKLLRFFFFIALLMIIASKTKIIAGYTLWQMVFFFSTYNFIDTAAQFFFRDVYRFRQQVVSGYFDNILLKPISPLFKTLFGGSDILDLSVLFLSIVLIVIAGMHITNISVGGIVLYILLLLNAFLIAVAFHILVLAMGIVTTEVDNTIMLYRDLTQMGRIPIDVYQQPLQGIITFLIPVGVMMTFPAKAIMGLLSPLFVLVSFGIGIGFFLLSIFLWKQALKRYSSASS